MERAKNPSQGQSPLVVHTVTLTEDVAETLRQLSSDASDFLGRTVSDSAIIRALVRQVGQQGPAAADALFIEIEKEMKGGRIWGKKK